MSDEYDIHRENVSFDLSRKLSIIGTKTPTFLVHDVGNDIGRIVTAVLNRR
jgi:hypothetical protein